MFGAAQPLCALNLSLHRLSDKRQRVLERLDAAHRVEVGGLEVVGRVLIAVVVGAAALEDGGPAGRFWSKALLGGGGAGCNRRSSRPGAWILRNGRAVRAVGVEKIVNVVVRVTVADGSKSRAHVARGKECHCVAVFALLWPQNTHFLSR